MNYIFFAFFAAFSMTCHAVEYHDSTKSGSIELLSVYRDYSETDPENPDFKSDEYGSLFGLNLNFTNNNPEGMYLNTNLSILGGSTKYDGALISFADGKKIRDVTHQTKNTIVELNFNLGKAFYQNSHTFIPYVGLGLYSWNRELGNGS